MPTWSDSELAQLKEWLTRAKRARAGHRDSGKYFARLHRWVGNCAVSLSVLTGGGFAASLQNSSIGRWVLVGTSGLAGVLTYVQTVERFDRTAERHEIARSEYASVCREIERVLALDASNRKSPPHVLQRIARRLDELAKLNTPIPEMIWKKANSK